MKCFVTKSVTGKHWVTIDHDEQFIAMLLDDGEIERLIKELTTRNVEHEWSRSK